MTLIPRSQPTVRIDIQGRRTDSARYGPPSRACRHQRFSCHPHIGITEKRPRRSSSFRKHTRGGLAHNTYISELVNPYKHCYKMIFTKLRASHFSCSSSRHASVSRAMHVTTTTDDATTSKKRCFTLIPPDIQTPRYTRLSTTSSSGLSRSGSPSLIPSLYTMAPLKAYGITYLKKLQRTCSYPLGDFEAVPAPIAPYTLQ